MSLPSVDVIRSRIESVGDTAIQRCLQADYLFAGRIGEVVAFKSPRDDLGKKHAIRGNALTVQEAIYTPDISNADEVLALLGSLMLQGKDASLQEIAKIREQAAVFMVATQKREGKVRSVALPLNASYEPWTKPLLDYFKERFDRKEAVFPFTRQYVWMASREIFKGLKYKIESYRRNIHYPNGTVAIQTVPEHMKPFRLHALRHLRASELENFYGFTGSNRSAYGGWTLHTTEGVASSQDRYVELQWRKYFPKLLKPRQHS